MSNGMIDVKAYEQMSVDALDIEVGRLFHLKQDAAEAGRTMEYIVTNFQLLQASAWFAVREAERSMADALSRLSEQQTKQMPDAVQLAPEIDLFLAKHHAILSSPSGFWISYKGVHLMINRADGEEIAYIDTALPGLRDELAIINEEDQ